MNKHVDKAMKLRNETPMVLWCLEQMQKRAEAKRHIVTD